MQSNQVSAGAAEQGKQSPPSLEQNGTNSFYDFFSSPEKLNESSKPAINDLEVYMYLALPAESKHCDVIACGVSSGIVHLY